MRIIGGAWRGRRLTTPAGTATRPTADRVRQALFDMLMHAPWGGRPLLEGATVLDAFAGTGALGLEALSRGAAHATFVEKDRAALAALRANIAACGATARCTVIAGDVLTPATGPACGLAFLDPPYGQDLVPRALATLRIAGRVSAGTVIVAETGCEEMRPGPDDPLAERTHGAAKITIWQEAQRAPPA
jgi:16S rRNA (guanine966-N2)-methyltransferase